MPVQIGKFTDDFELSIKFAEPKALATDKDKVELEALKLEMKLTTKRRAIKAVDPQLETDQIEALIEDIRKEELEDD